jgi:penicillin-binding protein 2
MSALGSSRNGFEAIKNLYEEKRTFTGRVVFAAILCLVMIGLLALRLIDLQLLQHDYYTTRADDNRMRLTPIAPVRGLIYDRNGALLAQNLPSFVLDITPERVKNLNDTIARLRAYVKITDQDVARFRERMRKGPRYRSVTLRSNLTPEEVARYQLNRFDFEGVEVNAGLVRDYPLGMSAAHVIGYVGGISEADYAKLDEAAYQGLSQIGKSGVERSHEEQLRGVPGASIVEANAAGRPLRELDSRPGSSGQNLYLSLDAKVQLVAEKALGDLEGAVVAIDPRNGEVLALVSKPGYDPKLFSEGIDAKSYRALLEDKTRPLYNRALLGTYPPGSTIKPFMATAALNFRTVTPDTAVYCGGAMTLPGSSRKYRCHKRQGHGTVNLDSAIAKSCDIYFYQAAQTLGIDRIDEILGQFGFGSQTGIDVPNEKAGLLPSKDWKRRAYRQPWYPGETLSIGIGQGYLTVTPVQLAQATARIAMRGQSFRPHVVHAVSDPATGAIAGVPPEPLPPLTGQNAALLERVIHSMQLVNMTAGGTAFKSFKDAPYTSAGKTGTAQVASLKQDEKIAPTLEGTPKHLRDHALFIAFAPVDEPRIAVAVIAEHAGHGGSVAAPVARQVMDQYLLGEVRYGVDASAAAAAASAAAAAAVAAGLPVDPETDDESAEAVDEHEGHDHDAAPAPNPVPNPAPAPAASAMPAAPPPRPEPTR